MSYLQASTTGPCSLQSLRRRGLHYQALLISLLYIFLPSILHVSCFLVSKQAEAVRPAAASLSSTSQDEQKALRRAGRVVTAPSHKLRARQVLTSS